MFRQSNLSVTILALILSALSFGMPLAHAGSGTSGGGNALNDQVVDLYMQDFNDIEGFKEKVSPIIKNIDERSYTFASNLHGAIRRIAWYLIPAKNKELGASVTGLPFDSDQPAVQSNNEVFIDQNLFQKMSIDEKGALLLHEIVLNMAMNLPYPVDMGQVRKTTNYLFYHSTDAQDQFTNKIYNDLSWFRLGGELSWPYAFYYEFSAIASDRTDLVQNYLKNGFDVNSEAWSSDDKYTPLMVAAFSKMWDLSMVNLLISSGAKIDHQTPIHGYTALMLAANANHVEIVKALLAAGADKGLKNKNGQTALDFAIVNKSDEIVKLLKDQTVNLYSTKVSEITSENSIMSMMKDQPVGTLPSRAVMGI